MIKYALLSRLTESEVNELSNDSDKMAEYAEQAAAIIGEWNKMGLTINQTDLEIALNWLAVYARQHGKMNQLLEEYKGALRHAERQSYIR